MWTCWACRARWERRQAADTDRSARFGLSWALALALAPGTAAFSQTPSGGAGSAPPPAPAPPAASCLECHDVQHQAVEASVHGKEKASCTDCHGGNPEKRPAGESERVRKVKAHDASKGFVKVPVDVCTRCHADAASAFEEGPHGRSRTEKQSPHCWHCHAADLETPKAHEMAKPGLALWESTCRRCHADRPDLVALGTAFRGVLEPAERAVAEASSGSPGGGPLEGEFHDILRLQHGLNREAVAARAAGIVGRMPSERPLAVAWLAALWGIIVLLLALTGIKLKRLHVSRLPSGRA